MVVVLASCLVVSLKVGYWRNVRAPEKIVPAAVLPADGRLRDARERELLGAALRMLQRRMDSLAADSAGRRSVDSLVRARPGLMDSVGAVERLLSEQGF